MNYQAKVSTKVAATSGQAITTTIEGADLQELRLTNLHSFEQKCAECMTYFEAGEEVVVFEISKLNHDETISLDAPYLVHIKNKDGKVCLEDFIARALQSVGKRVDPPNERTDNNSIVPEKQSPPVEG